MNGIIYEQLEDGSWQCDWWEDCYRYGARGKTKNEALQNALRDKEQGMTTGIDWALKLGRPVEYQTVEYKI